MVWQPQDKLVLDIDALQHGKLMPYPEVLVEAKDTSASDNWEWMAYACGYRTKNATITARMLTELRQTTSFKRGECNTDEGHSILWLFGILFIIVTAKARGDAEIEALAREHLRQWIFQNLLAATHPEDLLKSVFVGAAQRITSPGGLSGGWRVEYVMRAGVAALAVVEAGDGMPSAGNHVSENQGTFTLRGFLEAENGAALTILREEIQAVSVAQTTFGWKEAAGRFMRRSASKLWTYVRFTDGSYLSTLAEKAGIPPTRFLAYYDAMVPKLICFPDYAEGRADAGTGGSEIDWTKRTALAWDTDSGQQSPIVSFVGKTVDVAIEQGPSGIRIWNPDAPVVVTPPPPNAGSGGSSGGGIHKSAGIYGWNFGQPVPYLP